MAKSHRGRLERNNPKWVGDVDKARAQLGL